MSNNYSYPFASPISYSNAGEKHIKNLDAIRQNLDNQVPLDYLNNIYDEKYYDNNITTKFAFQKTQPNTFLTDNSITELTALSEDFILPEVENYAKEYLRCIGVNKEIFELEISSVWSINYYPNSWQDIHNHNKCHFTCVLYVWAENLTGGDLAMINPTPVSYMFGMPKFTKVKPTTGDLLIMPGWMEHKVDLIRQGKRTVIVFDVVIDY